VTSSWLMRTPLLRATMLAASLSAAAGCSKSSGDRVFDAATGATSKLFAGLVEKDASREAGALIAKLKPGPECDVYRRRLADAGKGPPADGATQHTITWTYKEAGEAGCVNGP
jgi:hypothetical protein